MASITIPVPTELAEVYDAASSEDQQKIQLLMRVWLRESVSNVPLNQLMDEISDRAAARGLTPEILEKALGTRHGRM